MNKRVLQNSLCIATAALLAFTPYSAYAMSQDETVYAKLNADGSTSYLSVTEHLLNDNQDSQLVTKTTLENIENLNGFEGFIMDGNQIIWDASGKDIYYSGETQTALPIRVQVTYSLNGEEKPVSEMLGKSGKVEIHLKYTNLSKVGNLYTPFVAAIATTLPEATTRNASITNGKVISNGRTLAITALAAPGLYESLGLQELKKLDEVTLTYETDKFELNDIYTVVTPKVLNAEDLKVFTELDQLYADMDALSESSKELLAGVYALRDGISQIRDAVASAKAQLDTTGNLIDDATLNQISATASSAASRQVAAQKNAVKAQIHQQVSGMLSSEMQEQLQSLAPTIIQQKVMETCDALAASSNINSTADNQDDDVDNTVDQSAAPAMTCEIPAVKENVVTQVTQQVQAQFAALDPEAIETKLFNSTYGAMQQVAQQTASATARSVASQVAASIQEGMGEKLDFLLDEMIGGLDELLDGANALSAGMYKFDNEGIQKLNNFVNETIRNTSYKIQRLLKLADEYNNFAGIADGAKGTTKFILMIEGQK